MKESVAWPLPDSGACPHVLAVDTSIFKASNAS